MTDIVSDGADGAWVFGVRWPMKGLHGELVAEHIVDGVEEGPIELGPVSGGIVDLVERNGRIDVVLIETSFVEGVQWRSIRVVRMDAAGSLPGGQAGRTMINSPHLWDYHRSAVVPQEDGGLIVGWSDRRTDPMGDVYAQRLDANGELPGAAFVPAVQMLAADPTPTVSGAASLRFVLGRPANVSLRLVDVRGCSVRTLLRGEAFPPGEHAVSWDGKDDDGRTTRPGVYFVDVRANGESSSGRVVILR